MSKVFLNYWTHFKNISEAYLTDYLQETAKEFRKEIVPEISKEIAEGILEEIIEAVSRGINLNATKYKETTGEIYIKFHKKWLKKDLK